MNKKTLTIILILSHMMCILLGYCCVKIGQPVTEQPETTLTTEAETTQETTGETAGTTEESVQETEGKVEETVEETEVEETVPLITAPTATEPPVTEPPAPSVSDGNRESNEGSEDSFE